MLETVTAAAKIKVFIAALSLVLIGGLYSLSDPGTHNAVSTADTYKTGIHERTELVNNAVLGVVDLQGKQEAWQYKQTCENAVSFIRKQSLETDSVTTLSQDQRAQNIEFKAYLHEAYIVVDTCYNGKKPDLSKLNQLKTELR